jgi:nucleotide-binding universal stress UspA family protein
MQELSPLATAAKMWETTDSGALFPPMPGGVLRAYPDVEEAATTATRDISELHATQPESVFAHVLVGVDGTEPGFEACRQAGVLVEPDGSLELVCAVETGLAVYTGWSAARIAAELEREGVDALTAAAEIVGRSASSRLLRGVPAATLLRELKQTSASLVAVGSHGHRRVTEMMLGGVAGELLHRAPCSVLIARRPAAEALFPRSLVVGIDGSAEAERALAVALSLEARFGLPLRIVTAVGETSDARRRRRRRALRIEQIDEPPVDALREASAAADLLIVGSRGLHGVRALGSVSERVAHCAACSVLVVRGPEPRSMVERSDLA